MYGDKGDKLAWCDYRASKGESVLFSIGNRQPGPDWEVVKISRTPDGTIRHEEFDAANSRSSDSETPEPHNYTAIYQVKLQESGVIIGRNPRWRGKQRIVLPSGDDHKPISRNQTLIVYSHGFWYLDHLSSRSCTCVRSDTGLSSVTLLRTRSTAASSFKREFPYSDSEGSSNASNFTSQAAENFPSYTNICTLDPGRHNFIDIGGYEFLFRPPQKAYEPQIEQIDNLRPHWLTIFGHSDRYWPPVQSTSTSWSAVAQRYPMLCQIYKIQPEQSVRYLRLRLNLEKAKDTCLERILAVSNEDFPFVSVPALVDAKSFKQYIDEETEFEPVKTLNELKELLAALSKIDSKHGAISSATVFRKRGGQIFLKYVHEETLDNYKSDIQSLFELFQSLKLSRLEKRVTRYLEKPHATWQEALQNFPRPDIEFEDLSWHKTFNIRTASHPESWSGFACTDDLISALSFKYPDRHAEISKVLSSISRSGEGRLDVKFDHCLIFEADKELEKLCIYFNLEPRFENRFPILKLHSDCLYFECSRLRTWTSSKRVQEFDNKYRDCQFLDVADASGEYSGSYAPVSMFFDITSFMGIVIAENISVKMAELMRNHKPSNAAPHVLYYDRGLLTYPRRYQGSELQWDEEILTKAAAQKLATEQGSASLAHQIGKGLNYPTIFESKKPSYDRNADIWNRSGFFDEVQNKEPLKFRFKTRSTPGK